MAFVYPVCESDSTQAFMPHLVGFFGMYCRKESRPLNPMIDSSIASSLLKLSVVLNFVVSIVISLRSLYSLSNPGEPRGTDAELSAK